jgi:uncharacterized protein involved in response to NO
MMYLLIQIGVACRLIAAAGPAELRDAGLLASAACRSTVFLIYVVIYGPFPSQARIDAQEG